jgi:hypothetical protein
VGRAMSEYLTNPILKTRMLASGRQHPSGTAIRRVIGQVGQNLTQSSNHTQEFSSRKLPRSQRTGLFKAATSGHVRCVDSSLLEDLGQVYTSRIILELRRP